MTTVTENKENKLYKDWLTGKYSLLQLAKKHRVSMGTASRIVTKNLKLKNK